MVCDSFIFLYTKDKLDCTLLSSDLQTIDSKICMKYNVATDCEGGRQIFYEGFGFIWIPLGSPLFSIFI